MEKNKHNLQDNQLGQTLIETLVAALVLVMGISAAVGLAVYGLNSTAGVTKQLVAVGLAREGVEAVKNIRDTNWLSTTKSANCWDFYTQTEAAVCYPDWSSGLSEGSFSLAMNAHLIDDPSYWLLDSTSNFGLDFNKDDVNTGFYKPTVNKRGDSGYSRKVTIVRDGFEPFDHADLGPRIKVRVDVWWQDNRCPYSDDVPALASCKVTIETYLTNWKNY